MAKAGKIFNAMGKLRGPIKTSVTKANSISKTAIKSSSKYGKTGLRGAGKVGSFGATKVAAPIAKTAARNTVRGGLNMVSPFLKESKHNSLLGVRVNKAGLGLLGAGAFAMGVGKEAKGYFTEDARGRVDQSITGQAPRLPSYSFGEQAGATGDLVFALNNNRKG